MVVCVFTTHYLVNVFPSKLWVAHSGISESVVVELDPFENSLVLNAWVCSPLLG